MTKKPTDHEPKQTTPKGVEIPIPTRDAVLHDLAKVAPPVEPPRDDEDAESQK